MHKYRRRKSAEIAGYLLEAIERLADVDQDNVSFAVIKLNHTKPMDRAKLTGLVNNSSATTTRVVHLDEIGRPKKIAASAAVNEELEEPALKLVSGGK